MANIQYGASGQSVKDLQEQLINLGYDVGSFGADGVFGAATQAAVKKYQQDQGLAADGIVGVNTSAALANSGKVNMNPTPTTQQSSGSSSGSSSASNPYAGTNYHQNAIDAAIAGNWDEVLAQLNNRDNKIAATGQNYGRTSIDIYNELQALYGNPEPEYTGSSWDAVLNQAANDFVNMNYTDWTQSDEYQALLERYALQGNMGMRDTLGQISSRTGGLASSYATTAAQQQYNAYMSQLEQAAMDMYGVERDNVLQNAQLAQALSDRDYQRYLDSLGNYWTEKEFNTNQSWAEKEYQTDQDRYDQSQLQAKAETLAAYGDFSGYKALGYTDEQIALMKAAYDSAMAAQAAKGSSSSGGGDDDGGGGDMDYEGLFTAAQESGYPKSWLSQKDNYKQYGFSSSSGLYDAYEEWLRGGGSGTDAISDDSFQIYLRSVERGLNNNGADAVEGVLGQIWSELSASQKKTMNDLLAQYGTYFEM